MNTWLVLLIILLLFGVGGAPVWGYHNYGWGPSGGIGLLVIVLIIILLVGRG